MSFYDPKTQYAVLVGLAGCIRSTCELVRAVDVLGRSLNVDATEATSPFPASLELDGLSGLLLLAAECSVAAERIAEGSGKVQRMRRKLLERNVEDVSRETSLGKVNGETPEG